MERGSDNSLIGVGLSGGADSAMAAFLLREQGFEVRAYTFEVWRPAACGGPRRAFREEAAAVARKLGIPHVVLDFRREFEEAIVRPFVEEYAMGRTPSPCVRCNVRIKFGLLLERMLADGCAGVATGHYARTGVDEKGRITLLRGRDREKDQSYFLAGLRPEQLRRIRFPLGDRNKSAIRVEARRRGLIPEERGESQDLCFLPDGDYAALLAATRPELDREGPIVDAAGRVLGTHGGAFRYTIGQRRGLGLSGGPWYVLATDPEANTVTVGPRAALAAGEVPVAAVNWLIPPPRPGERIAVTAMIRYNMSAAPAVATVGRSPERVTLAFEAPVYAVTPGQFAVLYHHDRVLGGGWIEAKPA